MSFRRLSSPDRAASIALTVDGSRVVARQGDSVATALLADGRLSMRESAVGGSPRAPYCLMGVCFECLVEVDGRSNVQACMTPAQDGMVVRTRMEAGDE